MLRFEEAYDIVMNSARWLGSERVGLDEALGRVLAEDVKSDIEMPPFNKSAMDGFACRREDLGNELEVIETIPAGYVPKKKVGANQCSKIMTGGMVPCGADCVVMKEYVEESGAKTIRFVGEKTTDNICLKGEDIKAGEVVLEKGVLLGPADIAVLATVGYAQPMVGVRAKVGVVATGDELVEPGAKPEESQIRNSNSWQLAAQAEDVRAAVTNYGIAKDSDEVIDRTFKKAMVENDVVIISGGVSVGEFDLVPKILSQNGVELLFEKILTKPGKPTVFGISGEKYCFGLPGNPVSGFVLFEILVKPFLYKLMGHDYRQCNIRMPLGEVIKRKKVERQSWIPVVIENGTVRLVEYHGAAHIGSFCKADGLISIDIGVAEVAKGEVVEVRLI